MKTKKNLFAITFVIILIVMSSFSVCAEEYAAVVTAGDSKTEYTDFSAAIAEALKTDGAAVTVLKDVTGFSQIPLGDFSNASRITIDINGKTVNGSSMTFALRGETIVTIVDGAGGGKVGSILVTGGTLYLQGVAVEGSSRGIRVSSEAGAVFADERTSVKVTNSLGSAVETKGNITINGELKGGSAEIKYEGGRIDLSKNQYAEGIRIKPNRAALQIADVLLPEGYVCYDSNDNILASTASVSSGIVTVGKKPVSVVTEIVSYDEANKSARVTVSESGTYYLIFADYNSDGRLVNVDAVEYSFTQGENDVPQNNSEMTLTAGDKVMLWNMADCSPLCSGLVIGGN